MEWIQGFIVTGGMIINTALDIKERRISISIIALMGMSGLVWRIASYSLEWADLLESLLPGMIALILALLTREGIGYGDVWMLLGLGLVLKSNEMMNTCLIALFLLGVCAIVLICVFHKSRKYEIAFAPFLLAGYLFSKLPL